MRVLSNTLLSILSNTSTSPGYLVSIVAGGTTYRFSSRETVGFRGEEWKKADIEVSAISPDRNEATVKIGNTELLMSSLIIGPGVLDGAVNIILKYKNNGVDYFTMLVNGVADTAEVDERWGTIQVVSASSSYRFAPRNRMHDTILSHLLKPGQVIRWGNEVFEVKGNG